MGIQVYGGHGYIKSNKQEQIVRDSRISAVWEGTTQIQALDLLGRKIMLEGKMRPINEHSMKIYKFTTGLIMSGATSSVKKHAFKLLKEAASLHIQTYKIAGKANSNRDAIGLASQDYLMISGYINLAHHWLRMEEIASKKLASGEGDAEFYESKVKSSEFYFENIFPRILSHKATMNAPLDSVMSMKDNQFSFDHAL